MYIASINLRINVSVDLNHAWPYRKHELIAFIKRNRFDIIGCQEASIEMVQDLIQSLSNDYEIVFQPRDERGEGTPVLYRKSLEATDINTYWLTDTPTELSKIAGSHFPRIVTMVRFDNLLFFNTHLDYASDEVSYEQVRHLVRLIEQKRKPNDAIIIVGDFNRHPRSKTIAWMTQHFKHIFMEENEDHLTYHGFSENTKGKPIDYIFYSKNIKVINHEVHHHRTENYLSDHYPISAHIKIIE